MASVLIVEDDRDTARLMGHWLMEEGHDVVTVMTGEGSLEALREATFDLILLDVRLPGISGYEVLRKIRSESLAKNSRVLFATITDDDDMPAGLSALSLPKPFTRDGFQDAVRRALARPPA